MTRAGFIALLGFPNAGKSTLFNRIIGQRLSAITPKPQTTRFSIPGILTQGSVQYIFLDTPGWVSQPKNTWHQVLTQQSLSTARKADVQLWVISLRQPLDGLPSEVSAFLLKAPALLGAFSHGDLLAPSQRSEKIAHYRERLSSFPFKEWIDASLDQPIEPLLEKVAELLPESPFLYPEGEITTHSTRFFVGELLRESLYLHLRNEVPYGTEVEIIQYKEGAERDYIAAVIHVERESHKMIVIGKNGQMLKKIGTEARKKIEELIGKPVFLDLHVKVSEGWRRSMPRLRSLGYRTS